MWLPGLSWTLFLNLDRRMRLLETIVLSLGVSLSLLSSALVGLSLLNVSPTAWATPFLLIVFSAVILLRVAKSGVNYKIPVTSRVDIVSIPLFLLHPALWLLYFWRCPIFPSTPSADPFIHATLIQTIVETGGRDLLRSIDYAIGLHFLLGFVVRNVRDELLVTLRLFTAFLESMTVLLVYVVSAKLFTKKSALIASSIYAAIVPIGIIHLTGPGTYANILGDFLSLTAIYFICHFMESRRLRDFLTLTLIGGGLLLSHVTAIIFLTFAWFFSITILLFYRKSLRTYLTAISSLTLAVALGLIAVPGIPGRAMSVLSSAVGSPIALGLVCEVWFHNIEFFLGLPGLFLMASALVLYSWKTDWGPEVASTSDRALWIPFMFGWFLYASMLSIQGTHIWRLVLHSLLPGIFILALSLSGPIWMACGKLSKMVGTRSAREKLRLAIFLCILIGIFAGSSATYSFSEFIGPGQRERQIGIYESMCWVRENTAHDALFASMKLPEYRYLPVIAHRTFQGDYELPLDKVHELPANLKIDYVAIPTPESEKTTLPRSLPVAFRNEYVTILKVNSTFWIV